MTLRIIRAESQYGLTAGKAVVMMKIVLVKKQEMVFIARVCTGGEKLKQNPEANMLILHPLTTLHTHLHVRHYRQIHLPT